MSSLFLQESFRIRYFGQNQRVVRSLLEEAKIAAITSEATVDVSFPEESWWCYLCSLAPRPIESVVLKGDQAQAILADAKRFVAARESYRSRGVPYRRGYLLHGPPGTGKTSLVHAIASELQRDIYVAPLGTVKDKEVTRLLGKVPPNSVVLLEDVDAAYSPEGKDKDKPVTLSSLLNAVDGIGSVEGRILFMTTNHADRLDDALLRPGRVDKKEEFALADEAMASLMYLRFFPSDNGQAYSFAQHWSGSTPARIQEELLRLETEYVEHIEECEEAS